MFLKALQKFLTKLRSAPKMTLGMEDTRGETKQRWSGRRNKDGVEDGTNMEWRTGQRRSGGRMERRSKDGVFKNVKNFFTIDFGKILFLKIFNFSRSYISTKRTINLNIVVGYKI